MRLSPLVLPVSLLLTCLAPLRAATPATAPSSSAVVGRIYGRAVTAADIRLTTAIDPAVRFDSRDAAKWALMGRILAAFGQPVVDRFVDAQQIDATVDEIKAVQAHLREGNRKTLGDTEERLVKAKAALASPNLGEEEKAKLERERASLERVLPSVRDLSKEDAPEAVARQMVVAWKIERALHRAFGGRVIFQQAGPEAMDARRRLFEQAERNGDLKFDDAGVRHLFYFYSNMEHTVIDEQAIERPWFLDDAK